MCELSGLIISVGEERELFLLLSFTCNYVVSIWRNSSSLRLENVMISYCRTPCAFHIVIFTNNYVTKTIVLDLKWLFLRCQVYYEKQVLAI